MRIRYSQRIEALDVAELGQLAPAADEGLLDGILGEVRVSQDQTSDRVETVDLASGEQPERVSIPGAALARRAPVACRFHPWTHPGRLTGSTPYDQRQDPNGSIKALNLSGAGREAFAQWIIAGTFAERDLTDDRG